MGEGIRGDLCKQMLSESCHIYFICYLGYPTEVPTTNKIKNSICEETLIRDLTVQAKITPTIPVRKRLRIRKNG